ncbi:MAG: tetratricopeptide repeat protein, partial [Candidatus Electrothrix sp. AR4]|nr:tetratricopeptide repeat protein [Candidatus Electrothrix sp. AR4]
QSYAQAEQYSLEKLIKSQYKSFTAKIDPAIDDEVDKALAYVEQGEFAQGETILNKLIQEQPDLYIVQYGMGTLQAMKGNYIDSIGYFDKCLEIFPYFFEAWYNRGNAYRELLKIIEIVKSYQKVVEFGAPEEEFVQRAKEFLEDMAASVFKDSGLSLEKYVESNDTFNNAFALLQNREYEKAIVEFTKVLSLNKNTVQTYGNLGLCHAFLGQRAKALAFFDQALEIDPAYAPAMTNRAVVAELKEGEKMPEDHVKTVEYYKDIAEGMEGNNQRG